MVRTLILLIVLVGIRSQTQCTSFSTSTPLVDATASVNPGVLMNTMVTSEEGPITDLVLKLYVTHSYVGDIKVELEHVASSTIVEMQNRVGGNAKHIGDNSTLGLVIYDDNATNSITLLHGAITPSNSGPFIPSQPLSTFFGLTAVSDWKLIISDYIVFDTGSLEYWEVCMTSIYCGDGIINAAETCDQQNQVSTDGCSYPACTIESGWSCDGLSLPTAATTCYLCGDGI